MNSRQTMEKAEYEISDLAYVALKADELMCAVEDTVKDRDEADRFAVALHDALHPVTALLAEREKKEAFDA